MSADLLKKEAGCLVVIVGPSGSGKDTLIRWLKDNPDRRAPLEFARRVITRSGGSEHEDSLSVSSAGFVEMERAGDFAVTWQAHGLCYGLPLTCRDRVDLGRIVVANGSRHALARIADAFHRLLVISITVEHSELARRLSARGRETLDEISRRLDRSDAAFPGHLEVVEIDNSGPVEIAGRAVLAAIVGRQMAALL